MGKKLLITGGTGSFGQKFVEISLKENLFDIIRVFSRGEDLQTKMQQRFNDGRLRFLIGDVRDQERLKRAVEGVDIVIHAAALKQIPVAEYNPDEAVKTNIGGATNVIDVAIDMGVEKVVALSSDKAVQPVNLYGATKLVAERLFVQANVYAGAKNTRFSCVRYGNVFGSRGSIVPLFREQMKSGEITITDENMTRFWITLESGVCFAISCLNEMQGGEIFIPKIPSMKVADVADVIAPEAKKRIIGLRPSEKMHEVLLTEEESRHTREFDNKYVIIPEHPFWKEGGLELRGELAKCERYASDTNAWWLTRGELKVILEGIRNES